MEMAFRNNIDRQKVNCVEESFASCTTYDSIFICFTEKE